MGKLLSLGFALLSPLNLALAANCTDGDSKLRIAVQAVKERGNSNASVYVSVIPIDLAGESFPYVIQESGSVYAGAVLIDKECRVNSIDDIMVTKQK